MPVVGGVICSGIVGSFVGTVFFERSITGVDAAGGVVVDASEIVGVGALAAGWGVPTGEDMSAIGIKAVSLVVRFSVPQGWICGNWYRHLSGKNAVLILRYSR